VYVTQPVPDIWNVVIVEVSHEHQIFPTSTTLRLEAHINGVRDVELCAVVLYLRAVLRKYHLRLKNCPV
jgi:hypothetical protein